MAVPAASPPPPPLTSRPAVIGALRRAGCVFAEEEADLLISAFGAAPAELAGAVAHRVAGEPLEVILGWAEFAGVRVQIDQGVFVPRRRTGFLVEQAIESANASSVVVDLCCGSGALGLALADAVPGLWIVAADIEPAAVACARRNLDGRGDVFEGDLFEPLPTTLRGTVELLMVNAPYVPSAEIGGMPPEARDHEPLRALDGGGDGLDVHRRVAAEAPNWLASGGSLFIEVSARQADEAVAILRRNHLLASARYSPEYDATVVIGVLARSPNEDGR